MILGDWCWHWCGCHRPGQTITQSQHTQTDSQTDRTRDRQTDGQRDRQRNSSSYKLEAVSHCAASICGCSSTWSCLVSRDATRHKSTLCVCKVYVCVCVCSVPVCLSLSVFGMCPKFLESEALTWQLEMPARDKHQTTATTTTLQKQLQWLQQQQLQLLLLQLGLWHAWSMKNLFNVLLLPCCTYHSVYCPHRVTMTDPRDKIPPASTYVTPLQSSITTCFHAIIVAVVVVGDSCA